MNRYAIADCEQQIKDAIAQQKPGDWLALLWELDQRAELHRLTGVELPDISVRRRALGSGTADSI